MALHTQLPIYKTSYDLLDLVTEMIKNMPREFKIPIGGKIRDEVVAIMVLVFRANVAQEKSLHLTSLIERLQVAELLLRLSRDKRWISTGQYASAILLTNSVGKQAGGWRAKAASPDSSRLRP